MDPMAPNTVGLPVDHKGPMDQALINNRMDRPDLGGSAMIEPLDRQW